MKHDQHRKKSCPVLDARRPWDAGPFGLYGSEQADDAEEHDDTAEPADSLDVHPLT